MKVCSIEGCGKAVFCRGWCNSHWRRWRRHGDPLAGATPRHLPLVERLANRSKLDPVTGCINWTGTAVRGYGRIRVGPREVLTHRLAFELARGPIPAGLEVLHRCDNPSCMNPEHLRVGTHTDNMRDMAAKGRSGDQRGLRNGRARLTPDDVFAIRASTGGTAAVAAQFGIAQDYVRQIRKREAWSHL